MGSMSRASCSIYTAVKQIIF